MRARSDNAGRAPPVRAYYSIGALAEQAGVNVHFLRRLLLRAGVVFVRNGRTAIVPLGEIRRCVPSLWESLVATDALRRAGERRAKGMGEEAVAKAAARGESERLL